MDQCIQTKRLNRWSDDPVLDRTGRPVAVAEHELQPNDIKCFELLARFRYLRTSTIAAFIGGNAKYRQRRLSLLARRLNGYLRRPAAQKRAYDANYRDQIYELSKRGKEVVRCRAEGGGPGFRLGDEKLFEHSVMICETLAALAISVRPGRIVWWDELRKHPKLPPNAPRYLRVSIHHQFPGGRIANAEFEYRNDSGGIFAIEMPGQPYKFFSFEAEHTNRVWCGNLRQASFLRKFLSIQHIMKNNLHKRQWGIPQLFHLVATSQQARIDSMIALITQLTNASGPAYILFYKITGMESPARGDIVNSDFNEPLWQRAGYPAITASSYMF